MSDNEIFNIEHWNKKLSDESHEGRFKLWLNALTKFNLLDKGFKRGGDTNEVKFANAIRISRVSDALTKSMGNSIFKNKDGAGPIFISILGSWAEEETFDEDLGARYLGTSLVFFPCYKQVQYFAKKYCQISHLKQSTAILIFNFLLTHSSISSKKTSNLNRSSLIIGGPL